MHTSFLLTSWIVACSALTIERVTPRANANGKTTTVSVPLYLTYWTITATINGQNLTLMIDTGSSDFWVHGPKAPDPSGSPEAELLPGQQFKIAYEAKPDAYIGGPVVTTKVTIGELIVPDMPIGVATHMGLSYPLDGFLGLGFMGINSVRPIQQPTFMLASQPQLQQSVFSLNLKSGPEGTLTFGSIDKTQYKGELMTAPVNNKTSPAWIIDEVTLTSGKVSITQAMLFDSGGADTMYAAPAFVEAYWHQVPASMNITQPNGDLWIFPCGTKLPDIHVSIGGGKQKPVNIPGSKLNAGEFATVKNVCRGGLQPSSDGYPGNPAAPFFTSAFVVFHQAEPSISIAAQG